MLSRSGCVGHQGAEIDLLAFAQPLVERAEAAAGDHDLHGAAGSRVGDGFLLEVGHLAALRFHVGVRNVVAGQRRFASNGANFSHNIGN